MSIQNKIQVVQKHAPVDVEKLAEDLGLEVLYEDLGKDISGKLEKMGNKFFIYCNKTEPNVRRRFTIAHEIGHFILHRHLIDGGIVDNKLYRDNRLDGAIEREANSFAADLLMPINLISQLQKDGYTTIEQVAKKLNVSQIALKIQLGIPVVEDVEMVAG